MSLEKYVGAVFVQDLKNETIYHIDVVSRRNKRIVDTFSELFVLSRKEDDGLNPRKKENELNSVENLNIEIERLNKAIDKIEAVLKIIVARKLMEDISKLFKKNE